MSEPAKKTAAKKTAAKKTAASEPEEAEQTPPEGDGDHGKARAALHSVTSASANPAFYSQPE